MNTVEQIHSITDAQGDTAKVRYNYFWNLAGAVDKLGAAVFGWPPDTTISADLALQHHNLVTRLFCHVLAEGLDVIEAHHVLHAALSDQAHAEQAVIISKQEEVSAAKQGT